MAPDSVQSLALVHLVEYFGWTKMAILASDTDYGNTPSLPTLPILK